jgi:multidrug efflux pump subunit AcrA (membrane-fusion protein)
MVNQQNVVEERKVKLGLQGKSRVEVLSGLNEGDRVIIGNQSQFRNGEKVAPKEIQTPGGETGGAS